jgi:hypothetical protein
MSKEEPVWTPQIGSLIKFWDDELAAQLCRSDPAGRSYRFLAVGPR